MNRLAATIPGARGAEIIFSALLGAMLLACSGVAAAQSLNGQVGFDRVYTLNVGVSGEVADLSVGVGDRVKAGTLLLSLDGGTLQPALEAAAADMAWKKALQEEAERAWERDNELYAEGSLSQVELDLSNIARLKAGAAYQRSRAEHAAANSRLKRSRIHAPVSGVVLEVNTHPGDRINLEADPGPLLVMGSARLVVRALWTGGGMALPTVGQSVEIAAGESAFSASVASVLPAADGESMVITAAGEAVLPPPGTAVELRF